MTLRHEATHLLEVANKRCEDRACERDDYDKSGEICLHACESMADFCDPCMIAQLVGTIEADLARLQARAATLLAFIGVMFGDAEGTVPTTVRTPLGIHVKLRALVDEARAALPDAGGAR